MRVVLLLAFLAVSFAAVEDVIVLTNDNFDEHIKANKQILVEFYAPWCGHCKKLEPEYEAAAEILKGKVAFAKVDATVEKEVVEKFSVRGYPTLYFFTNGVEVEYDGGRDKDGILAWLDIMTGPAVRKVSAPIDPVDRPTVVLHAPEVFPSFELVALSNRKGASFQFVEATEVKVVISHKDEEPIVVTDIDVIKDNTLLGTVWQKHSFALYGELNGDSYAKYTARPQGLIWSMFPQETSEDLPVVAAKHRDMMTAIAKKYQGKYSVSYTDTVQFKGAIENMHGVKEFPALAVYKQANSKKKYIYTGEFSEAAIVAWLETVDAESIEPTLRSEVEPASNDAPVRVVVGKTLEAEVFQAEKDVLFEVYAPWCGHCKQLEPEYEKVAKKIRKEGLDDIVCLSKMDGTANDSPIDSLSWDGFPAIFYIKAGTTEPIKYEGAREAKDIWKWIKKNHSKADKISQRMKANKQAAAATKDDDKEEL